MCHPFYKYRCALVKALWPLWRLPRTKRICSEALFFEIPEQPAPLEPFPPTPPSPGHATIWPPPRGHCSVSSSRRPRRRGEVGRGCALCCYLSLHSPPAACRRIPWLAFLEPTHAPFGTAKAERGVFPPRPFGCHCESEEEQVSWPGGGFWGWLELCVSARKVLPSPANLDGEARRLEPQSLWAGLFPWKLCVPGIRMEGHCLQTAASGYELEKMQILSVADLGCMEHAVWCLPPSCNSNSKSNFTEARWSLGVVNGGERSH